jgi:hypothetical protein
VARFSDLSVRNKKTAPFSTFTFLPVSERVELPLASALRGDSPTMREGEDPRPPSRLGAGYHHVPLTDLPINGTSASALGQSDSTPQLPACCPFDSFRRRCAVSQIL